MCGIGALSAKVESPTLMLREYLDMCYLSYVARRGTHSNGMAWVEDGVLDKVTAMGGPAETAYKASAEGILTKAVIGHVRLASQGGVALRNAHPFFNEDSSLAIIHNGHLSNSIELRKLVTAHKLTSETDSEIILHIFEDMLKKYDVTHENLARAMLDTVAKCIGSKNVIILMKDGTIIAYADGTLCMQKLDGSIRLASVPTTRGETWKSLGSGTAIVIKDGEIVQELFRSKEVQNVFYRPERERKYNWRFDF